MKFLIGISIIFFAGLLSSNAFGETEYVDDQVRKFSITLPEDWEKGVEPHADWGWMKFYKSGDIEPFQPTIYVEYLKNYDKMPNFSMSDWLLDGKWFEFYDAIPPEVWCSGDWKYRPDGYTYDMHCKDIEDKKQERYVVGSLDIHEIEATMVWESDWEDKSIIKKEQFFSKRIQNGIENWNIITIYDHDSLYAHPNLEKEIKSIVGSFNPILCKDKSSTRINVDGEINPIRGNTSKYQITLENPMDRGSVYVDVYGIDAKQFSSKNKENTHSAQAVDMRGSGDFFIKDITFHYLSSSFAVGETTINVANGCHLFQTSIIIRDENWNESEIISGVPAWVKNNAGWWADGTIDDDAFIQAIQFLIKEEIISIDSVKSSATESTQVIPLWVKNNADWWAQGEIDDNSFVKGIEFLVKVGVIQVN